ncbi:MAG: SdpI family protein [Chitinophagaceae bacterium]
MKKIITMLTWVIFLAPGIYLFAIWQKLPARIPMHFNLKGEVDRYGNPGELLLLITIISIVNITIYLLLANVHRFDPKKNAPDNKDRMQRMAFAISVFISAVLCAIIYVTFHQPTSFPLGFIFAGVGLLFSFIGNYMHNIKPNYFAGFRLPWTLENEDNWRKTHSLGGKLFFAGGLLIAITCLLLPAGVAIIIFFIITIIILIIPFIYSYRLFKKQKANSVN